MKMAEIRSMMCDEGWPYQKTNQGMKSGPPNPLACAECESMCLGGVEYLKKIPDKEETCVWEQHGNIWICVILPIITIEPDGQNGWQACCGGRPVGQIPPGKIIDDVMRRTMDYYDARIEMEAVKERW